YGEAAGFLFAWAWVLMAKPATNAIIATIFADYITRPFAGGGEWDGWVIKTVALGCVVLVTAINGRGATAGASLANKFLVVKLSAVGLIALVGSLYWVAGAGGGAQASGGWTAQPPSQEPVDTWTWIEGYGTALFGALFCYGGWETVRPSSLVRGCYLAVDGLANVL
ncbi:amino acid permease, partial [Candidatus Bathyarchaeota archaeon]|nr:amino acid permease [Candidatus Bathyarchaeota archaeon]